MLQDLKEENIKGTKCNESCELFSGDFQTKTCELNVKIFKNENVIGYLKSRTGTKKESPSKKTFNWRKILQFVTKFWKNTQNINNPGRWKGQKKTFSSFVVKKENRNIFSKKGESRGT